MPLTERLGNAAHALRLVTPGRDPMARTLAWYALCSSLFEDLCGGSGLLNFGLADPDGDVDLAEAQRALVRRVVSPLPHRGRWLDSGCGVGGPATLAAAENPVDVVGLNLSQPQLSACAARAHDRLRFEHGDAQEMPFEADSFDGVYAIESAIYYPDRARFVSEVARVLRPGGVFSLGDIVRRPGTGGLRLTLGYETARWLYAWPDPWSAADWQVALERNGFQDVAVEDLTARTLGLAPRWAERLAQIRPQVERRYPPGTWRAASLLVDQLGRRLDELPLGFVHLTAVRP